MSLPPASTTLPIMDHEISYKISAVHMDDLYVYTIDIINYPDDWYRLDIPEDLFEKINRIKTSKLTKEGCFEILAVPLGPDVFYSPESHPQAKLLMYMPSVDDLGKVNISESFSHPAPPSVIAPIIEKLFKRCKKAANAVLETV
ncbi:MAG: hypothetical protein ACPH5P_00105 [Akkermansiaceae bacterium]